MKHKPYIEEVLNIKFIEPQSLKPTEGFDPQRASELLLNIKNENKWTTPIMVEKNHLVIMDGHHRHQVAQMLDLKMIPCILLSYDNPLLELSSRIDNLNVNSEMVINAGITGVPLQYKSTKHDIKIELRTVNIPLELLTNEI